MSSLDILAPPSICDYSTERETLEARFNTQIERKKKDRMGNQIYKEISKFAERQRDEIKREKAKKKRKSVCIDPDSVIGKEIMYQTALLHEILDEVRGEKRESCMK